MISQHTNAATSSQASQDGSLPSTGQDGKDQSGPVPVPVSRFRAQDSAKAMPINATCGPLFTRLSPSASLQRSLASRLQARMEGNGSPLYALTWSEVDMPAGVPILRLRALGRRISDNAFSGWPTPKVSDDNQDRRTSESNSTGWAPGEQVKPALSGENVSGMAHPSALVIRGGYLTTDIQKRLENGHQDGFGRPAWIDIEYIPCADGKARPTQPGIHPLANGIPGRVGKLRAYGNAIVPQLAAEFVMAHMEPL